jgi:hypothetical protein
MPVALEVRLYRLHVFSLHDSRKARGLPIACFMNYRPVFSGMNPLNFSTDGKVLEN